MPNNEIKIKIKIKGDVPTPPPPQLPPPPLQNNFQIGNALNGSCNCCPADNEVMTGWGVERQVPANKANKENQVDEKHTEDVKKEVEEKPENNQPKAEEKPHVQEPKDEGKPVDPPKPDKQEPKTKPPVDKTVPDEKYKPLPNIIPKDEAPFEIPEEQTQPQEENAEPAKTTETEVEKKPKELTSAEVKEARTNGKDVADFLVGYTTDAEQKLVSDIVKEKVNEDNVMEFIKGYTENKELGDNFFEQLESEYGFDEAQNIMRDVATKAKAFYEKNNQPEKALEIGVILENNGFTEKQVKELDAIMQSGINTSTNKKRPKFPTGGALGVVTGGVLGSGVAHTVQEIGRQLNNEE